MSRYIQTKPSGFSYFPEFLTAQEEKTLLNLMAEFDWRTITMHGVIAKRRVVHFGYDYLYQTRKAVPTDPPPIVLNPIIKKAAVLLKVPKKELVEILITEYPVGAGIGWHTDSNFFGDQVFGISLGSTCTFKLRQKKGDEYRIYQTELSPGSAYIIAGPARYQWEHSITAVKTKRYSITLRTLSSPDDFHPHRI